MERPAQLEPFAEARRATLSLTDESAAALSQAISAKRTATALERIADALESVVDPTYDAPAVRTRESR